MIKLLKIMFKVIWKITKLIPKVNKIIADLYYFFQDSKYNFSGKNNLIDLDLLGNFSFIKKIIITIEGDDNKIQISSGAKINNTQFNIFFNHNLIVIEKNVVINGGCIWIKSNYSKIFIGKNTTIVKANIGIAESNLSITIRENCMLAHDIDIRCGDSHSIIDLKSGRRINYAQDIYIGNSVWLATGVKFLKSLTIGAGCIIGTGSIVTNNIPENCLAVGIPALVKKTDVTWLSEKLPVDNKKCPK